MNAPTRTRIGAWVATPALNLLENGAQSIKIEPRTMDVLAHLASRPGEVVSVEELLEAVWRGVVVGDSSVYMAIKQLRRALASGGDETQYIETIPKRGYRLTAPVERLEVAAAVAEGAAEDLSPAARADAPRPAPPRLANERRPYRQWALAAAVLAGLSIAGAWLWSTPNASSGDAAATARGNAATAAASGEGAARSAGTAQLVRFEIPVAGAVSLAVSPDGRYLAYASGDSMETARIYLRPIGALEARPLAGTEGATVLFWSPDSRHIAFGAFESSGFRLKRIALDGGAAQTLAVLGGVPPSGSWNADGVIVFDGGTGIERVAASGGGGRAKVTQLEPNEGAHVLPSFLPDGRRFLFATAFTRSGVYVQALESAERVQLLPESAMTAYASGYLLFNRGAALVAQRFDPDTLTLHGEPIQLSDGLITDIPGTWAAFSVSQTGVLAYAIGEPLFAFAPAHGPSQLTWYDRRGRRLQTVGEPGPYRGIALSPDGRIAVHRHEDPLGGDIWVLDEGRDTFMRLTFGPGHAMLPVWSPDGRFVLYTGNDFNLYRKPSSGVGTEELVLDALRFELPSDWSRDGSTVFLTHVQEVANNADISALRLGERAPILLEGTQFNEAGATLSPDGRWLAYDSDESGRYETYVRPYPDATRKWQASTAGGSFPRWSHDGRELFYLTGDGAMMAVPVEAGETGLSLGAPRRLFRADVVLGNHYSAIGEVGHVPYAVSPDGERFLINERMSAARADAGPAKPASIVVLVNWTAALEQ